MLQVWQKLFAARTMKDKLFVNTAEGRVSLWDLLMYVKDNPELEKLAQRDINLAVPVEGMTRCVSTPYRAPADPNSWSIMG